MIDLGFDKKTKYERDILEVIENFRHLDYCDKSELFDTLDATEIFGIICDLDNIKQNIITQLELKIENNN